MYKFIQKNQKKFLAIFGVLLMVVFILPTSFKNNMSRGDLTIGAIDGAKITGNELGRAKSDLELLRNYEFMPLLELGGGGRRDVSVYAKYFRGDDGALAYLLLQKEAEKEGFSISPEAAGALAAVGFESIPHNQVEPMTPAVGRFMLVQAAFERASESVKASKPLVLYYRSLLLQYSELNLVEYSAAEMEKSVPAPTAEQIRRQYDKYGDSFPKAQSFMTTQASTPGYKVPDRVKLQYLELPRAAVVDSVLKEQSPDDLYQLDLEGYRYYDAHRSEFPAPTTRRAAGPLGPFLPASKPSTGPTTGSATLPAAVATSLPETAPATERFPDKGRLELRQRLLTDPSLSSADMVVALRARVAAREKQLQTALHDELDHDYAEWAASHSGKLAETQPAHPTTNPLIAIYPDLDFLTDFANAFEAKYKVRPLVTSLANKWLTRDDLESTPEIESAKHGDTPFAEYALHDLGPVPTTAPALGPPASLPSSMPAAQLSTNPVTAPTPTAAATTTPTAGTTTAATTTAVASTEPTTNPSEPTAEELSSWHPIGTGLRPFEPSDLLKDPAGNTYVFRLTAFEPAHRPPLADVEHQIVDQLKSDAAFQLARDDAAKLLENARIETRLRKEQRLPNSQGLPAAARASGRKLIEAGPFQAPNLFQTQSIPGYDVSDMGDKYLFFYKAVEELAKQQTPDNPHPSALIELPAERKVLVAEMADPVLGSEMEIGGARHFRPLLADEMYAADDAVAPMATKALESGQVLGPQAAAGSSLLKDWFDLNNVIARVKYIAVPKG